MNKLPIVSTAKNKLHCSLKFIGFKVYMTDSFYLLDEISTVY